MGGGYGVHRGVIKQPDSTSRQPILDKHGIVGYGGIDTRQTTFKMPGYDMAGTPATKFNSQRIVSQKEIFIETNLDGKSKKTEYNGHDNLAYSGDNEGSQQNASNDIVDENEEDGNKCSQVVNYVQTAISEFTSRQHRVIWPALYGVLAALFFTYFGYAMYFRFGDEGSVRLLVVTVLATIFIAVRHSLKNLRKRFTFTSKEFITAKTKRAFLKWFQVGLAIAVVIFAVIYIIIDIGINTPKNLISAAGIASFVLLSYVMSYNPAKVKWQPVFWGIALQFIFALIILRWNFGYEAFQWIGDRVGEFLTHSDAGALFVFGEDYERHFFAFKVLPVIVFFSTCVSILYYLGVMQFIIKHVARFLAACLGTSPTESLNAAGNIFLGQTEAPLMIRPFMSKLTKSEMHAVCTGGFATIAGSVMAAYILYGVPANHLLSASVMSAPAGLAMAKLFYPETEITKHKSEDVYNLQKGSEKNIIEAASVGASQSIKLVANVAVNLIAFVALLEFVNATLKWLGRRVGLEKPDHEELTFQFICSYVFWPLSFLMGVEAADCRKVAELVGIKTFINEFVAYTELAVYIDNAKNLTWYEGLVNQTISNTSNSVYNGTWHYDGGDIVYDDLNITLRGGVLSERSVVISTYALCGFANISAIGIQLGALGGMAPERKGDLSSVVIRAMIAGNVACFMTACIAEITTLGAFKILVRRKKIDRGRDWLIMIDDKGFLNLTNGTENDADDKTVKIL